MLKNLIALVQKIAMNVKGGKVSTFPKRTIDYTFDAAERKKVLLDKLAAFVEGEAPNNWKASRLVYRIGELKMKEAAPLLLQLVQHPPAELKEEQFRYSLIRTLGRCQVVEARPWLQSLLASTTEVDFVKRIALDVYLQLAPSEEVTALQNRWAATTTDVPKLLKDNKQLLIETLFFKDTPIVWWREENTASLDLFLSYLLSFYQQDLRAVFIEQVSQLPFNYPAFQGIRYIFKSAESREDFEVLGLLTYRLDSSQYVFVSNGRYYYSYRSNERIPIALPPESAFSNRTKSYFQKRVIRHLQLLGEEQLEEYCRYAVALLQYYQEEESTPTSSRIGNYRYVNDRYRYIANDYQIFNRLPLVWLTLATDDKKAVKRYANRSKYRLTNDFYQDIKDQRSEPFPELWDQYSEHICTLLQKCKSTYIAQFALRILWGHDQEQALINKQVVIDFLKSPVILVAEYGLHHLARLMPEGKMDWEIIIAMIHSPLRVVQQVMIERAISNTGIYFRHPLFIEHLALAKAPLVVDFFRANIEEFQLPATTKDSIYQSLLAAMFDTTIEAAASILRENIQLLFADSLATTTIQDAERFLEHSLESGQLFGTDILLAQKENIPTVAADTILGMLQSKYESIRSKGMEIFGCLPIETLLEKKAILLSLAISENPAMRESVKPVIAKIANGEAAQAQTLVQFFLPVLLEKETYEGLHQDILELLMNYLDMHLEGIPSSMIHQLEAAPYREANILSAFLLNQVDFSQESIADIVRLADHEMLDIRQYCFTYFNKNIGRIRYESSESLRLLDAKWEDSRQFGFDFFEKHFKAGDWTPELLVSICDSTRSDVQAFGKKMIQRFFQEADGAAYLLQLSQHPAVSLQLFATTYLDQFASNDPAQFIRLKPYFKTVLCQLQKGGATKKRLFDFLEKEALSNNEIAKHTIEILNEVSLTIGIRDKARCIQLLYQIKKVYPELESVLELKLVD